MKPVFSVFIRGNVPSLKNSKRVFGQGKGRKATVLPSKNHESYEQKTFLDYYNNCSRFVFASKDFVKPLVVRFFFVRDSKRRFDLDNAVSTVQDLMVKQKWIEDDSANVIIPKFDRPAFSVDKNNPGVRIELHEQDNERKQ